MSIYFEGGVKGYVLYVNKVFFFSQLKFINNELLKNIKL